METTVSYIRRKDQDAADAALATLDLEGMKTLFLPVVSIKRKHLVGLEAVGCGLSGKDAHLVDPNEVYRAKKDLQAQLALERVFRAQGMEGYLRFRQGQPDLLLFLDVDGAILRPGFVGTGHLVRMVRDSGIDPSSVAIVVNRAPGMDPETVRKYAEDKRRLGFLVAMGNVDASREGLGEAFLVSPDLLRLEKTLAQGLSRDPIKREGVGAVVRLAREKGALVAADGVENEEDALAALEAGVDLLQGPYFSRSRGDSPVLGLKAKVQFLAARYRRLLSERMREDVVRRRKVQEITVSLMAEMEGVSPVGIELRFADMIRRHPSIQGVYLLGQDGVQIGEVVCNRRKVPRRKRHLFQPTPPGADLSATEPYNAVIDSGGASHLTEPGLSPATGQFGVTFSGLFRFAGGQEPCILCADIDVGR